MGNGMNRVLPGLYVGNYRDSKDAGQLERHKITHIIAIHDAARRLHCDKEYLCIQASDTAYQNLQQYFPTCNDFIHTARIQGGNALIHCLAGMSRSVTIVVAYIMSITSLRWNEALKVVRGARAVSNPNSGFQKQLQEFETTKLSDERRRLLEKFPGTTQLEHDEENCRRLLIAYDHLLLSRAICEGRCNSARVCPTGTCRAHASPRLSRQKSNESSTRGSTKSLDSANESPSSPRNWERHYGCWKNHFRHQQSSSTPASPILYRASKSQRSDSMLSISSISSITSLPGQVSLEKEAAPCISLVDRNPFLASQSCPNSPRRLPRKLVSQAQPGPGVSQTDISRMLSKERQTKTTSTTAISNAPSTSSLSVSTSGTSTATTSVVGSSSTSWGTPTSPCHRFMAHNATAGKGTARNTVKISGGITRWVMKRSAYKFTLDKS